MRVVDAGYEIIKESDVRKRIERGARLCYKSEDFIKEGSDVKIIKALGSKKHTAMFEHGNLVVRIPRAWIDHFYIEWSDMMVRFNAESTFDNSVAEMNTKRSYLRFTMDTRYSVDSVVSGNMRAWIETLTELARVRTTNSEYIVPLYKKLASIVVDLMGTDEVLTEFYSLLEVPAKEVESSYKDSIKYSEKDLELIKSCHEQRENALEEVKVLTQEEINNLTVSERLVHDTLSVILTVDRGVTHEMVRMRRASFAQESTRYCNYAGDKYDSEITVIKPVWYDKDWSESVKQSWERAMLFAEEEYMNMMKDENVKAQQARAVLPNSLKSDIMVTAPLDEWRHIFALRACDATGPAHPQMKEVMIPLLKEVKEMIPGVFDDLTPAEVL